MTSKLGIDVGGTFTDLLWLAPTGETLRAKVPSTPHDQSIGVKNGIDKLRELAKAKGKDLHFDVLNHGTTIATNAILEGKGAKVALLTTEGYKDILQIRRSQVPGGLAGWIVWPKPEPLAPLELTIETPGRVNTKGLEIKPFDAPLLRQRLQSLLRYKPDAITVSLMNSFANAAHEVEAAEICKEMFPGVPISISSQVLPELMEYERTLTTVANSYVKPKVGIYLDNFQNMLGQDVDLRVLRSDGGLASVDLASQFPVNLLVSGPSGGVAGVANLIAKQTEFKNLLTFDMGGTSTDVALIENGVPHISRNTIVGDLTVKSPSVDVRTVGAGGGSIARVPELTKALRVGPESAGAVPGPACYSRGGVEPTVSDANAVLGYLPSTLLGGDFKLDIDAAKKAVMTVADALGIGLMEAAEGILRLANESMLGALRVVSIESGYDPRDFALVAFGGAGPMHACALGRLLHSKLVIVPPSPGVLCAFGDATTTLRHETSMTFIRRFNEVKIEEILSAFKGLATKGAEVLEQQGIEHAHQVFVYEADVRYSGQALTLPISFEVSELEEHGITVLASRFESLHKQLFTFILPAAMEIVNCRVKTEEKAEKLGTLPLPRGTGEPVAEALKEKTHIYYAGQEYTDVPIFERSLLRDGDKLVGPCIVTELDSNTLVTPDYTGEVDHIGNILLRPTTLAVASGFEGSGTVEEGLDPIVIDIIESALRNARTEMDTTIIRTAMSPAIREQRDTFPMIANAEGKMMAGQFGSFIPAFLKNYHGTVEEGDVFLTNDPYSVGGSISHLNDYLVIIPIFFEGQHIAWTADLGHFSDVGGRVAGSLGNKTVDIFGDGTQIPIIKLFERGVPNTAVFQIAYRNSRLPHFVESDLQALIAACRTAGTRMQDLCSRFGIDVYNAAFTALLDRNKRAIGSLILSQIPEEGVYFEDYIDDDGFGYGPWKIACKMFRKKDEHGVDKLVFDWSGTDPQSDSSINFLLSPEMWKMFANIYLVTVFDPSILVNDGANDLMEVYIPEGTILNPIRPAALSCRTHLLGRVMDMLTGLFGQKAPAFLTAAGFSDSPHLYYSGYDEEGEYYLLYQISTGGIPARPVGDGPDGHSLWPSMQSVPNEFLELYYPLIVERYESIEDSGGPGYYRGGNGLRIHYRFLAHGEVGLHDDRWLTKPWGVTGGEPGMRSTKTLVKADGTRIPCSSKADAVIVAPGDLLESCTWGGGGKGNPLERDPELVALEVSRRLVTINGARSYGVVVNDDFTVDKAATEALRAEMSVVRAASGVDEMLFNTGGSLEEIISRCEEETGLPAPIHPSTRQLKGPMIRLPHIQETMKKWKAEAEAKSAVTGTNGVAVKV